MKLLRNLVIAASAFAIFSGVSALAADDFSLEAYDATNNAISVSSSSIAGLQQAAGDQMVVAVVPAGATAISESNLVYINTDASSNASALLSSMLLKDGIADGNYEVWVGGTSGTKKVASFTKGSTGITYLYGDVNNDTFITNADSLEILKYEAWDDSVFDDGAAWREKAGDVNEDTFVTNADALEILKYEAWDDSVFDTKPYPWTFVM